MKFEERLLGLERGRMTEKEAKKILMNTCCFGCEVCYEDKKGCNDCEIKEATKMAIEALEKQVPRKPVKEWVGIDTDEKEYCCPSCGYGDGCDLEDIYDVKNNYCPRCGQKLLWEETE